MAFVVAGGLYLVIGLAQTELASAYPAAGGTHYYTLRGAGDFWGFIASAALLLDYTLHIALFCAASAGYFNFFFPAMRTLKINLGPVRDFNAFWMMETLFLILFLMVLNIRRIRGSSLLNDLMTAVDLIFESVIIVFAWYNPHPVARFE